MVIMILGVVVLSDIEYSGLWGKLKVPLKAISIIIIALIIYGAFPNYMNYYPEYQNAVMGNESLPTPIKIFIVATPPILFICVMIILMMYIINSMITDIMERRKKFSK